MLKFLSRHPLINILQQSIIKTWGFLEVPMVDLMDNFHVLLHMANKRDYLHAWAREGHIVTCFQIRLFNWSVDFDVNKEPSIVVQWIFLPSLPLVF